MQAKNPGAQPATVKVKVLRAFQNHRQQILVPGKDDGAELPRLFAIEMQAANKVKILPVEPAPEPPQRQAAETPAAPKGDDHANQQPRRGSKEK